MSYKKKFVEYTTYLAAVLKQKDENYGHAFDDSVDQWGDFVLGIRVQDKMNRIVHILKTSKNTENDKESLFDNFLDLAGYSILAIRYLDSHSQLSDTASKAIGAAYNNYVAKLKASPLTNSIVNNEKSSKKA